MYLVFNIETTGTPRSHLNPTHPAQPHPLQFAGIVFDNWGRRLEHLITLVKPGPGALMSTEAYMTHRIPLHQAAAQGLERSELLIWFKTRAAQVQYLVSHGISFDLQVMTILSERVTGKAWSPTCPTFCTMAEAATVLRLPPTARMIAAGRNEPKPLSLTECHLRLFGEDLMRPHDAIGSIDACFQLFRHLMLERGTLR